MPNTAHLAGQHSTHMSIRDRSTYATHSVSQPPQIIFPHIEIIWCIEWKTYVLKLYVKSHLSIMNHTLISSRSRN